MKMLHAGLFYDKKVMAIYIIMSKIITKNMFSK